MSSSRTTTALTSADSRDERVGRPPARSSQSARGSPPGASRRRRWLGILAGIGLVGGIGFLAMTWKGPDRAGKLAVASARRASLNIVVTERGNLESQQTVDGICELHGYQNKITYLVPEGTRVKKGQEVCKFDDSEIRKSIAQQDIRVKQAVSRVETTQQEREILRNAGESTIIAAMVDLSLAELDLEKFQRGDYPAELTKQEGEMRLKRKDVEAESSKLEQYKSLLKRGFKTLEDVRIQTSTLAAKELDYSSSQQFLDVKKHYEQKRRTTELLARVDQSRKRLAQAKATAKAQILKSSSECEAARATAEIEQQQLKDLLTQQEKSVIRAQQEGILAYANDASYDSTRQIREGATVYSRQKIFSLPDMARMQVKTNIHESLIKKIRLGQKAEVHVDAFPNVALTGTVKAISPLADSTRHWLSAGIKEYTTIITLDDLAGYGLKPGMTAETRILAEQRQDVLVVPLQAVAEHEGEFYSYIDGPAGLERRSVKIGEANEQVVEILDGLHEGESVALDARSRVAEEAEGGGFAESQADPDSPTADRLASRP